MSDDALEAEPRIAAALFGPRLPIARRYVASLASEGGIRGLIGPSELPRLWTRHVLNCAAAASVFTPGSLVGDVGSGAGLPGIPLAIARPDVSFVLIEPMERRAQWLSEQAEDLGLENVTVERARAEDAGRYEGTLDAVTARAVSALRTLIPWTAPLLRPGGELVLIKGRTAQAEIDAAAKAIKKHRLQSVRVEELGVELLDEATTVVRAHRPE